MHLLLASKSAARRAMLDAAGVAFDTIESRADEDAVKVDLRAKGLSASDLALDLAKAKALAVAAPPAALVLGADQTLEMDDGAMLDKPASREDARAQLRLLSGRTHRLHSAAVLVREGHVRWQAVETVTLTMRSFSDTFLNSYLDAEYEAIRWGVGGYRIEGPGVQLFTEIGGSHFAILGLPLLPLLDQLRDLGLLAR